MRTLAKLGLLAVAAVIVARLLRQEPAPEPAPAMQATRPVPPPEAPAAPPTEPEGPASEEVEGYCVKERKKVRIKDPERTVTKNGREAVRGTCPDCGTKIFRFV